MRGLKKTVAILLLIAFTYSLFSVYPPVVHAAVAPVNVYADKFDTGRLDFHWDAVGGTKAVVLTYHTPVTGSNSADTQTVTLDQTTNNAYIEGLKSDYIYDIDVKLYDQTPGASVEPIGHGLLYYIPKITFYAAASDQIYDNVPGGGREIGNKPKLQLKWIMPRAYHSSGIFDDANKTAVLEGVQNNLNSVYNDGRTISSLNFRINISSDFTKLNSGSSQAAVLIEQNSTGYRATVSGGTAAADISATAVPGYMSFVLCGRSDPAAELPDASDGLGANDLPHGDIYPGTVYYMNIKPVFKNSAGANVNAVSAGNPEDQNGSLLSGPVKYTYTSIRFQLTKDSANNIYVKIYKINQGSLDLPRLYYQVQSSDDPSVPGDWTVKKTMDDTYFSGESAITVISGVNPNNEIYYKIVVKSESPNDRLESQELPYILAVDTSRPPVPTNIAVVKRELVYRAAADGTIEKSTNVTVQWDKPVNWDTIKAETVAGNNINFYLALNTSQLESAALPYPVLEAEGRFYGAFPLRYRVIAYISAKGITEEGSKLQYTIKGFDLFKGSYWDGTYDTDGKPVILSEDFSSAVNAENYPELLLPNKIYYLQMFSAKESDRAAILDSPDYFAEDYGKISDRSIITSFTTLTSTEMDVPLPSNFRLEENTIINSNSTDDSIPAKINQIELMFDKVNIKEWSNYTSGPDASDTVYYDIYMNTRTDTGFVKIGSTDGSNPDVHFTGATDSMSSSVRASISKLISPDAVAAFGEYLKPNTTYYFYLKTRLHMKNTAPDKESINTAILAVTTSNISITPPDDSMRKPLAVTDFAIASNADGSQQLSGYSVSFSWLKKENDVKYELICTGKRVLPEDTFETYKGDLNYQSFIAAFDEKADGVKDGKVYLDPSNIPPSNSAEFKCNNSTGLCTYTINTWLFPNKLYYFSLRAVRKNPSATSSVWVSIPVTTSLIEAPQQLEVINDAQLGFYWSDTDPLFAAEDFSIFIKGPGDADYKPVTRSQSTIVKDNDGRTYYGRVMGLKLNSSYDIRVYKGTVSRVLVYEKKGMATRDGFHELLVRWKGLPSDRYSKFELALRSEDKSGYTVLDSSDLEAYFDKNGQLLPYYTEETQQTVNNDYVYYYAKIKMSRFELSNGILLQQPLRSNMKYYIKIRTRKIDPSDLVAVAYSKYAGPVEARTEFNQDDYDNTDNKEKGKAVFLDKIKDLEKGLFWRLGINSSTACKILLKGDTVSGVINNTRDNEVLIDISELNININTDIIYIPVRIISMLNRQNKSLLIRTSGAEYAIRPKTLDIEQNQQVKSLQNKAGVNDIYISLRINRLQSMPGLPSGYKLISDINDLEIQAVPSILTEKEIYGFVNDKLYNKANGLVNQKMGILENTYIGTGAEAAKNLDEYTRQLVKMLESELSGFLDSTVEASKIAGAIQNISVFDTPPSVKLYNSSAQGFKAPYVLYDNSRTWQKLSSNIITNESTLQFNPAKSGKYVILIAQASSGGIAADHWAREAIMKFTSRYDLSDIFPDVNTVFGPDNIVTCREMVLLFEKVTERTAENAGLDIRQKAEKLKLDNIINTKRLMKSITRQEAAGVLAELLGAKKNLDAGNLRPGRNIYINDDFKIDQSLYNFVLIVVDKNIMTLDSGGNFNPAGNMNRAEVVATLVRLLEV